MNAKIDIKKWKTDLDALLYKRKNERAKTEKKDWAALDYYYDDRLTKLYSIRAQFRGRLHRSRAVLNYSEWMKLPSSKYYGKYCTPKYDDFNKSNGVIKFILTIDDQMAYIGDDWMGYIKE